MTDRRRKLLAKVEQNLRDVSPQQMDTLLTAFGFEFDRQRGSHMVYRDSASGDRLVFPLRRPHLLAVYVSQAVKLLRERLEEDE